MHRIKGYYFGSQLNPMQQNLALAPALQRFADGKLKFGLISYSLLTWRHFSH